MAERPVFVPLMEGEKLVSEITVGFKWNPGMAESQKRKNISGLHEAAKSHGLNSLLEISSKSEVEVGRKLSAFSVPLMVENQRIFVECAYQGSKVFQYGGPYIDLFNVSPRDAKRDLRLRSSGHLVGLEFMGNRYPLSPKNAFYDWLYIKALIPHKKWILRNVEYEGYTDIEFNPAKSVNCQARAFAEVIALAHRGLLERAGEDFNYFVTLLDPI